LKTKDLEIFENFYNINVKNMMKKFFINEII